MKKIKIAKIAVSAAMVASMAVLQVQAEENEPENGNEVQEETTAQKQGPGITGTEKIRETVDEKNQEEKEEEYVVMGEASSDQILTDGEVLKNKYGYGPHLLLLEKEEEKEAVQEEIRTYTEEDLYVLAHAICGEGQGYPDEEQLYIGSVILNRRAHGAYPDSIKGVVFQRGQYACTRDGNYYREPTEANWRNARWLLENGSVLPADVVYQAGFRQGSGLYVQTRYHKYCYR